jgi:hypothetical protein
MNREFVRRAAAEFFLEGFTYAEIRRIVESTPAEHRVEAFESLRFRRTVPDGCFTWIAHLIWLESMLEFSDMPLTAEEAVGLGILKRERIRFQAEHPPCPQCGLPNEALAFRCRECMAELKH